MGLFKHDFLPRLELERIDGPTRYYKNTVGDLFPSVTTVLSASISHPTLDAWRARVGEDAAKRIAGSAAARGTAMHKTLEKFLLNEDVTKLHYTQLEVVRRVKPLFVKHINEGRIFGLEFPLNSYRLWTAGTCDCLAEWDGKISVVDFKSSKYAKDEDMILSYFLQATAYALMANHLYGLNIEQIVILVLSDHDKPQPIVKNIRDYVSTVEDVFGDYRRAHFEAVRSNGIS